MSDDDVVIVCGLGHLSEVELEPELSPLPLDIDLVVFAVKFDRKGRKRREGSKRQTDMPAWHAKRRFVLSSTLVSSWDPRLFLARARPVANIFEGRQIKGPNSFSCTQSCHKYVKSQLSTYFVI